MNSIGLLFPYWRYSIARYLGFRAHREATPERAAHVILPQMLVQEGQDAHPLRPFLHGGVHYLGTGEAQNAQT